MIEIGRVISFVIDSGIRLVKGLYAGANDRRTGEEISPFGIDSAPPAEIRTVIAPSGVKGEWMVLGYVNEKQLAAQGETRLYSVDGNGDQATYLWLKADGTIEIGGNADTAVKFSELKTAFDQLKADYDDLVTKVNNNSADINTFSSAYVPGSPTVQGLPATFPYGNEQGVASTADIDPAEEADVKLGN